jgi:hypothetical protein
MVIIMMIMIRDCHDNDEICLYCVGKRMLYIKCEYVLLLLLLLLLLLAYIIKDNVYVTK